MLPAFGLVQRRACGLRTGVVVTHLHHAVGPRPSMTHPTLRLSACAVSSAAAPTRPLLAPVAPEVTSSSGSSAAASAAPKDYAALRQLYKSAHHGSGTTPMPKPLAERKLKSRSKSDVEALLGSRSSCAEDQGPVPERALTPLQRRQLMFKNKAAFVLAPAGLRRVKYLLSQYTKHHPEEKDAAVPTGIRIGVRRRGCSGYSYTVNYYFPPATTDGEATLADSLTAPAAETSKVGVGKGKGPGLLDFLKKDVVVEQDGVKVVVDADALFYVIGTEMDYVVRNVEEKFTFKNPNQKFSCGCEESFMPFDEDDMDD